MKLKRAGFLTKLIILVLLVYMATSLLELRGKIDSTQAQLTALTGQLESQRLKNQELADALEHQDDPEMLEQMARDKGYVKQGETLYIDVAN